MRRQLPLLAAVAVAVLGLAVAPGTVAADGDLAVDVDQAADGSATVAVTHDGSAATDATVSVATTDGNDSYAGAGEYATDENGTVGLPAPAATVEVSVSASTGNHSGATTATLSADTGDESTNATDAFGQLVSQFVQDARENQDGGIGSAVASFVLANNPAAGVIPDHAGPPAHVTGVDANATDGERGPPDHAGPGNATDGERGPPGDAGPGGADGGQGPPGHAGGTDGDTDAGDTDGDEE